MDAYRTVMKTAYPIHPELFDRLYKDWSTLERFQRTRGVLRLMATVVYALWISGDKSPMILPASIPLDSAKVFDELAGDLPGDSAVSDDDAGSQHGHRHPGFGEESFDVTPAPEVG